METCNSGAKFAVLNAPNHRLGLGPVQTCNSGYKVAVLNAPNHRLGLGPVQTCNSGYKVAVSHAKSTDEGWDPLRLVTLVLNWLFCIQKPQMRSGTHRD